MMVVRQMGRCTGREKKRSQKESIDEVFRSQRGSLPSAHKKYADLTLLLKIQFTFSVGNIF